MQVFESACKKIPICLGMAKNCPDWSQKLSVPGNLRFDVFLLCSPSFRLCLCVHVCMHFYVFKKDIIVSTKHNLSIGKG